ncbi:MAG: ABC transporter ATP-binding protein [Planctomycetota bacterium]
MKALELQGITRIYERGARVLSDVDLGVDPGEVVGLLGANGAGKTTLIRIALGMLRPQGGEVRVFGLDPKREPVETKRRVGYVSEDQVLPPYLRVGDVLGMHAELFDDWDPALAQRLSERFELEPKRRVSMLSKGQARRVAVVSAIAHRPELLVLDEPAGGLDPAARREMLETALEFLADEGSAILFSSHHMADVERIAGRVALLDRGHMVVDQDLDDLRETTMLLRAPVSSGLAVADVRGVDGCLAARAAHEEIRALLRGTEAEVTRRLEPLQNGTPLHVAPLTLEDLFIEFVEGRR